MSRKLATLNTFDADALVEAAELAPHRRIVVTAADDSEHLDYVVLSAHNMYGPFGAGALVGWKDTFPQGAPEQSAMYRR